MFIYLFIILVYRPLRIIQKLLETIIENKKKTLLRHLLVLHFKDS